MSKLFSVFVHSECGGAVKQLNLFSQDQDTSSHDNNTVTPCSHVWRLSIDGASRNNPGPAGIGIYLTKDNVVIERRGYFVGIKTNNEAEYFALVVGLLVAREFLTRHDELVIISDSQLLVRQMQGIYRVKTDGLRRLHTVAQQLIQSLRVNIMHVLRAENSEADKLANIGIDKKQIIPTNLILQLQHYELSL